MQSVTVGLIIVGILVILGICWAFRMRFGFKEKIVGLLALATAGNLFLLGICFPVYSDNLTMLTIFVVYVSLLCTTTYLSFKATEQHTDSVICGITTSLFYIATCIAYIAYFHEAFWMIAVSISLAILAILIIGTASWRTISIYRYYLQTLGKKVF